MAAKTHGEERAEHRNSRQAGNRAGRPDHQEKLLDFRKMLAIMEKNFRVLVRDKTRLIPLLLFPFFMIVIFGFTAGNAPKHIPTAIVAYDYSPLSQQFQQAIADSQTFSINYAVSTEGEAKRLLDAGKVRVIIILPPQFQQTVDSGQQASITIIVDESDSAVAATSTQTLNQIVVAEGASISRQRLAQLQLSVGEAAQRLQAYGVQQQDGYGEIASITSDALVSLQQSKRLTDNGARALTLSLTPPTVSTTPFTPSNQYAVATGNNTIKVDNPADAATKAQIAMLTQSSAYVGSASRDIQAAVALATKADRAAQARQDPRVYAQDVLLPMQRIQVFTAYDANGLLQPLVYEEKPAYGTGKRAIDFLIPAIIALAIFQGAVMGMGRAVAGEKREGSLTRVFLTPTSNATIIFGTLLFYVIFELFRSSFLIALAMVIFNVKIEGSILAILAIMFIYGGVSTAIGMILSSLVKTEQQYMAMSMVVSIPTMFLAGVFFPVQAMPKLFQGLAAFLPNRRGT